MNNDQPQSRMEKRTGPFAANSLVLVTICGLLFHQASGQTGLSSRDQQELLNAHNHFRGIVSPSASNMETMVWNAELARVAQNYAERCVFEHNNQRTSQQRTFSYVGENIAISNFPVVNYTNMVRNWFDERDVYNYQTNGCRDVCGHYTQVVWAASNSLGCGAFRCAQTVGFSASNGLNLVCNYGPGGNIGGQRPYRSGGPCSECSEGLNFCVSNLCSSVSTANTVKVTGAVVALLINFSIFVILLLYDSMSSQGCLIRSFAIITLVLPFFESVPKTLQQTLAWPVLFFTMTLV